jgi:excisionase family DNA binding protein
VKWKLFEEIQSVLQLAQDLAPDQLPRFLGDLEMARSAAFARLIVSRTAPASDPDRLVAIDEASRRLGVSDDYLYRHSEELPFTRRMGRKLLFSSKGIEKYVTQNASMTPRRHSVNIPPPVTRAARGRRRTSGP